jgi:hypothetical protein
MVGGLDYEIAQTKTGQKETELELSESCARSLERLAKFQRWAVPRLTSLPNAGASEIL